MKVQKMSATLLVSVDEVARLLSLAPKTLRNWISIGTFPVSTFLIGRRRMIRLTDLVLYVSELGCVEKKNVVKMTVNGLTQPKRERGRPRKLQVSTAIEIQVRGSNA